MIENNSKIIYVTWPSWSWKDTLIWKYYINYSNIVSKIVAHTTRDKRDNEIEWYDYYFVNKQFFNKEKENMLDILEYQNNFYWLHKNELDKLNEKKIFLWQANFEWVFKIIEQIWNIDEQLLDKIIVFALKWNIDAIEDRLRKRWTESEYEIQKRLEDVSRYNELYKTKLNNIVENWPIKLIDTEKLSAEWVFQVSWLSLLKDIIIKNNNNSNDKNAPIFTSLIKKINAKYFNLLNSVVTNYKF
jgi:guanylate kinase